MRYCRHFQDRINCPDPDAVFAYLIETLKDTIHRWDYFVNWAKVFENVRDIEVSLNTMNYLIGKEDIEAEFAFLLKRQPAISVVIPILIGLRQGDFKILSDFSTSEFSYKQYSFVRRDMPTDDDIADVVEFARSVGLLEFLKNRKITNLVDYVVGLEVGLDSNGRKNRSGTEMEDIVEGFVRDICTRNGLEYIKQATAAKIKDKWGLRLVVDKSSRIIDFALHNRGKLYLIETNFYSVGGSKLKSTAGEYRTMHDFWRQNGYGFIWITDGMGWRATTLPLRETFNHIDYVLNLDMVAHKLLEDIVSSSISEVPSGS
ncbi:Type II site-specific deoxyribonuclease [Candidatus Magnetobacterium bavaricum]|uniref:Type-2 restriction enzyme n=1 Tax=Candidatus Magnetobacterium bavaricum TaxID=29290 RepID=A0A0F3GZV0_9BACT|nr:Type II site-specific deoxyribonuclease [Candidatus Magnetobacterium bavaricum]